MPKQRVSDSCNLRGLPPRALNGAIAPWRFVLVVTCLVLLALGPFLHAHLGSHRIMGFHLPWIDLLGLESNRGPGAQSPSSHDRYVSCKAADGLRGHEAEWPESASFGVGQTVLREQVVLKDSSVSLWLEPLITNSWALLILCSIAMGSQRCVLRWTRYCSPYFRLIFRFKLPSQGPPHLR